MMKIKYYGLVALACLTLVAGFVSCRQDDSIFEPTPHNQSHPKTKGKKANGQIVSLNLEAKTTRPTPSKPRAMEYTLEYDDDEFPKLKLPNAGEKIKVLTIFRKLGDESTTTYADLDWTIVENDKGVKTLKYVGKLQLNEGTFVKDANDEWYMMGIIGGSTEPPKNPEEEPSTDETEEVSPEEEGEETFLPEKLYFVNNKAHKAVDGKLTMDVPYILHWTKVNIVEDGEASNKTLKFKPLGNILRVRVQNGMQNDYTLKGFRIASNYFYNRVAFNLQELNDEEIKKEDQSSTPLTWQVMDDEFIYDKENFGKWSPNHDDRKYSRIFYTTGIRGIWSAGAWPFEAGGEITREGGSEMKYYMSYDLTDDQEIIASGNKSSSHFVWMMPQTEKALSLLTSEGITPSTKIYLHVKPTKMKAEFEIPALPSMSMTNQFEQGHYSRIIAKIDGDLIVDKVAVNITDPAIYGSVEEEKKNFVKNFSYVQLYNPTLSSISLKGYALVKTLGTHDAKFMQRGNTFPEDEVDYVTSLPLEIFEFAHNAGRLNILDQSRYEALVGKSRGGDHSSVGTPRYKLLAGEQPPHGIVVVPGGQSIIFLASGFLLEDEFLTEEDKKMRDDILFNIRQEVKELNCVCAIAYSDGAFDSSKGYFEPTLLSTNGGSEYTYNENSATLDIVPMMGFTIVKDIENETRIMDSSIPYSMGYTKTGKHEDDMNAFREYFDNIDYDHAQLKGPFRRSMGIKRVKYNDYPRMYPVYLPYDNEENKYPTSSFFQLWEKLIEGDN